MATFGSSLPDWRWDQEKGEARAASLVMATGTKPGGPWEPGLEEGRMAWVSTQLSDFR